MTIQDAQPQAGPIDATDAHRRLALPAAAGVALALASVAGVLTAAVIWAARGWADALAVYVATVLGLGVPLLWLAGREARGTPAGSDQAGRAPVSGAPVLGSPDDSGLRTMGR